MLLEIQVDNLPVQPFVESGVDIYPEVELMAPMMILLSKHSFHGGQMILLSCVYKSSLVSKPLPTLVLPAATLIDIEHTVSIVILIVLSSSSQAS